MNIIKNKHLNNSFLFFEQYTSTSSIFTHNIFDSSTAVSNSVHLVLQENTINFLLYLGVKRLTLKLLQSVAYLATLPLFSSEF